MQGSPSGIWMNNWENSDRLREVQISCNGHLHPLSNPYLAGVPKMRIF
jgi:hypothetical protein